MKKIVLAGDSLAVGLAPPLQRLLPHVLPVAQDGRRACDAQHIPEDASRVILSLGTNDVDRKAPLGWESAYAQRLQAIMRTAPGALWVWLLPPPMEEPDREFFVQQRRTIIRATAALHMALVMEPWPGADYTAFLNGLRIRDEDGIHCTPHGYALWAQAIVDFLERAQEPLCQRAGFKR
ncbi:MAG: hypothetical protein IJU37_04975 [Desulfovibrio sp.]|nr:hypothetical protein [Desulfovibrio sp.]